MSYLELSKQKCLWGSCYSIICFMCSVLQMVICTFSFGHCVVCPSISILIILLLSSNSSFNFQEIVRLFTYFINACFSKFIVNGLTPLTGSISAHATRRPGSSALCITNDLPATTTYLWIKCFNVKNNFFVSFLISFTHILFVLS